MPRIKRVLGALEAGAVAGTVYTSDAVKMLAVASKDATFPDLTHVWVRNGDLIATDRYVLVVMPGAAEKCDDGPITREMIQFAKKMRVKHIRLLNGQARIATGHGDVVFPRPNTRCPADPDALVKGMEFDGSHQIINPQLLLNVAVALGLKHGLMLTRQKSHNKAILATSMTGKREGVPWALVMPIRSGEPGADEK